MFVQIDKNQIKNFIGFRPLSKWCLIQLDY
jgi:hypothetical protein